MPASVVFSLKVVAPVVITPTDDDVPGASVVRLVSAVVPPTIPPKFDAPAVLTTSVWAPFTVLASVTFPEPVLVRVVPVPRVTASL